MRRKTIYLVRHGEALHNLLPEDGTFPHRRDQGLADPPLTPRGEEQAQAAAKCLSTQLGGERIQAVVSSPLRRALKTAELAFTPSLAPRAPLYILEAAGEVLCDDIWNEPRDRELVAADWPGWRYMAPSNSGKSCWSGCDQALNSLLNWSRGHVCKHDIDLVRAARDGGVLDTAQSMVARAEVLWANLCALEADVIAVASHACFLYFFWQRIQVGAAEGVCPWFANGEIRRLELPPHDGVRMTWDAFGAKLDRKEYGMWNRYSRRAIAVNRVCNGHVREDCFEWTQREWRFCKNDEDFDAAL